MLEIKYYYLTSDFIFYLMSNIKPVSSKPFFNF